MVRASRASSRGGPNRGAATGVQLRMIAIACADGELADAARAARREPMTDLVDRARAGDDGAFAELYRRHAGRMLALGTRLAGDPGRGEELLQDVFVRAWSRLDGFRGESGFGTWLHRLAVNVVLSDRRAVQRRLRRVEAVGDALDALPATLAAPGERLDLDAAIARLPEGARAVFVLHDVEGYRHAEIGDLLGIAEGTSKAQLFRARRLLREALDR